MTANAATTLHELNKRGESLFSRGNSLSLMMSGLLANPEEEFAERFPALLPEVQAFLAAHKALVTKHREAVDTNRLGRFTAMLAFLKSVDPQASPSSRVDGVRCTFQTPRSNSVTVTVLNFGHMAFDAGTFRAATVRYSPNDDGSSTTARLYVDNGRFVFDNEDDLY